MSGLRFRRLAPVLLPFVLALSACKSEQEPSNPLRDAALLPPTQFRGVVRRDQSLAILPVLDERTRETGAAGLVDQRSSVPATELVRGLLGRQISLASLFSSVRLEEPRDSDLVMTAELLEFDARETGIATLPTAHASVELRVTVATRGGESLLQKRYIQRRSQDGSMMVQPDALALGCEALQGAVDELLIDLDHLDLGTGAPGKSGAPDSPGHGTSTPMAVLDLLDRFRKDSDFAANIRSERVLAARPVATRPLPERLDPRLKDALRAEDVTELWSHQAAAVDAALDGEDVAIVTGTASGKSLCYNVPVLDVRLRDPRATALYLFPTKALTQDQVAALDRLVAALGGGIRAGTYDGDTPPASRKRLRETGDVVLTNPYMLHSGILPGHARWTRFFAGLRYVVVDEMHGSVGVFGSHVANVLRRLERVAAFHGARPQYILCSATIRNPAELARRLTGRDVRVIDEDGSPSGEKHFIHLNPPLIERELGIRRSALDEACRVVSYFAPHGVKTIAFAHGRNSVELLTRYLKDEWRRLGKDPELVRGYRGGYLPELRRTIERELRDGTIDVVVSTNALELGIDVGALDLCVLAGYPGSRSAFLQQAGRAGRRRSASAVILVGRSTPLDQYVLEHPDYLHGRPPEACAIDPDNLVIFANQMKCAAFELPFREGDRFGERADSGEVLDFFATEAGILRKSGDRYFWAARPFPADQVSLDASDLDNVVITDVERGTTLAEVDRPSAQRQTHEGAIYQHQGETWQIVRLDWDGRRADAKRVEVDYYTEANVEVDLQVLTLDRERRGRSVTHHLGDVSVKKLVTMFQKLRFYTRENVGTGPVNLPPEELDTTAYVLALDDEFAAAAGLHRAGNGTALLGLARLLRHVAPLFVKSAPSDFGVTSELKSPRFERPALFLFDDLPGGVGLAEQVFERAGEVFAACASVLERCPCDGGCPGCIGPGLTGDEVKQVALALARAVAE